MQREAEGAGPLRNGNPRGDPNKAPRCGARTRSGCACRAPAMPNGRCRMHGGASTGARTAEGRAKAAAAPRKHGAYGAPMQAWLRGTRELVRDTQEMLRRCARMGRADFGHDGGRPAPFQVPPARHSR